MERVWCLHVYDRSQESMFRIPGIGEKSAWEWERRERWFGILLLAESLENWESKRTSTGTDGRENPNKKYCFIFANAWPEVGGISFFVDPNFLKIGKIQKKSLKINTNIFKKVAKISIFRDFFQLFWKFLYWFSMKFFEFSWFSKNPDF